LSVTSYQKNPPKDSAEISKSCRYPDAEQDVTRARLLADTGYGCNADATLQNSGWILAKLAI
jgi:hypothetical protein